MESTPETLAVEDILDLRKNEVLAVDPEYQRGPVWTPRQKQYFVDSIMRGYHIPLIYLHSKKGTTVGRHRTGDRLYIIDGQQRVQALYEYSEGAFPLLDPKDHPGRFPKSLIDAPCEWAARDMHQLDEETRHRFCKAPLSVVYIETDDENEVRDLFIRLQGGKPLTPQEQRDAWPGKFGAFVCTAAGKKDVARYPGREFFRKLMRANVRAETPHGRQLAAQMIMLYAKHRRDRSFCDIKRRAVDSFYVQHMDFDDSSALAKEFLRVLDSAAELRGDGKRPLLVGHQAIHVVLLIGTLRDGRYVPESWRHGFADAFDSFTKRLAQARSRERAGTMRREDREYMENYGYKARTSTDLGRTIRDRHRFFCAKMLERIQPRQRDGQRLLGPLEREIVYWRDERRCKVCGQEVLWDEAQLHHIEPHADGGPTTVENAALVHQSCHPLGEDDVARFAAANR